MADQGRGSDDRTSGTNQESGDMIDASGATQGASPPPSDGSETRGQQGEGMQDVPEVTGDGDGGGAVGDAQGAQGTGGTRETGRVGQGDMNERGGQGGYGGSSGFEGGAKGPRDS
jgi:hypothetical protein